MKKVAMFVVGLVALVSLSGCSGSGGATSPAKTDDSLKAGTFVAAKWQDQNYYLAIVEKLDAVSGKYTVKFEDDIPESYTRDALIVVPPKLNLKEGAEVFAAYPRGGRFYPAKVKEVNDLGVIVSWYSGDDDSLLPQGRIVQGELK